MFKKYTKNFLDREILSEEREESIPRPSYFEKEIQPPVFKRENDISDVPETILGEKVSVKGTLTFDRLLRIDGSFEGELISDGKLIVGPTGSVKANINLKEAYIAGKIEGDISVKEKLVLRGRAEVLGNITAPILSVDEGVSIVGQISVIAPSKVDSEEKRSDAFAREPL
jgi:cytoskeletal protein CcmA (bactofilin family)